MKMFFVRTRVMSRKGGARLWRATCAAQRTGSATARAEGGPAGMEASSLGGELGCELSRVGQPEA